jgi:hypothetical protein
LKKKDYNYVITDSPPPPPPLSVIQQHVQIEINKLWTEIERKAQMVDDVIRFLNSKSQQELFVLWVNDKTTMIMNV